MLFCDLSGEELDEIIEGIYEPIDDFSCAEGAVIYEQGYEDNAIYTIRSGFVKLVRYLPDGRERIIRLMKPADSIGLEFWASALFQADDCITMVLSGTAKQRVAHLICWLSEVTHDEHESREVMLNGKNIAALHTLAHFI